MTSVIVAQMRAGDAGDMTAIKCDGNNWRDQHGGGRMVGLGGPG